MPAWGDGSSAFVSKVRSWLLVLRKMGGWIRLEVSVPAVGGGGEFRSKIKSARGVASADGLLGDGLISFAGTSVFCSFLQSIRAMEYSSIWIWAAAVGSSVPRRRERCSLGLQGVQGPRSNIFLLKALCASTVVLLYSVFLYGLPVSVLVFVRFS